MFPLLLILTTSCPVVAPPPPADRSTCRVGQIFIVGNEITSQGTILAHLPLIPGQSLSGQHRATITRRLSGLRILGIRAKWSLLESDSAYKDIKITVEETWQTWLLLGPRSAMDDLARRVPSGGSGVAAYCIGRDHPASTIVRTSCNLLEMVYDIAPTSTLLTVCAKSSPLTIAVRLFVGVPETLLVFAPVLGPPTK